MSEAERLPGLSRRALLSGGAFLVGALAFLPRRLRAEGAKYEVGAAVQAQLEKDKLVHVCPLKSDGRESSCHAEVWYFWDRGAVVIATATKGWKVRAVKGGKDKARLWVRRLRLDGRAHLPGQRGDRHRARRRSTACSRATPRATPTSGPSGSRASSRVTRTVRAPSSAIHRSVHSGARLTQEPARSNAR